MKFLNHRIKKAKKAINNADYILIGAGAGLSTSAGIEYSGKRFKDNFQDFIEAYGLQDMYSASFYPFESAGFKSFIQQPESCTIIVKTF